MRRHLSLISRRRNRAISAPSFRSSPHHPLQIAVIADPFATNVQKTHAENVCKFHVQKDHNMEIAAERVDFRLSLIRDVGVRALEHRCSVSCDLEMSGPE
jgi:flagellar basal body-associated protein FliL